MNNQATQADPRRVADVTLAAAIRAKADAVFIEPDDEDDSAYAITFERDNETLTRVHLEASVGTAVIARLAFIAELDLAGPRVVRCRPDPLRKPRSGGRHHGASRRRAAG